MNSNTETYDEINVYFFNVGAGDSIIIEFCSESNEYVVIDSNLTQSGSSSYNPGFEFLLSKNVSHISTLIISHLHQDHYTGIEQFLENFKIEKLVIPPFLSVKSAQYNKIIFNYREEIKNYVNRCSDPDVFKYCKSMAHLLHFITNNDGIVEEASGKESILRFPNVPKFFGRVFLPLKKITGVLHNRIEHNDYDLNQFPQMNDSSIAFSLSCYGHNILLTGDSTISQWNEHRRQMRTIGITNLNIDSLKVPHHGSKYDNTEKLYSYIFGSKEQTKYAFTSADGINHPDKEIFDLIKKFNLLPYCTNLSQYCLPLNVLPYKHMSEIPDTMRPFLVNYAEKNVIPCQGDICLSINAERIQVTNTTGMGCVYREVSDSRQ